MEPTAEKGPAISTPPLTVRLSGTAPIRVISNQPKSSPPKKMPSPTSGIPVFFRDRIVNPKASRGAAHVLRQADQFEPVAGIELAAGQHRNLSRRHAG